MLCQSRFYPSFFAVFPGNSIPSCNIRAKDANYLQDSEFEELMEIAKEVGRILGGLRKAVELRKNEK